MPLVQNPVKAVINSTLFFDIDPVPMPTPVAENILQADLTLYTVPTGNNPGTGKYQYLIGGADVTSYTFNIVVQYMTTAVHNAIMGILFSRSTFTFSPDSLNYYNCVFEGGKLQLELAAGSTFYEGKMGFRVVAFLGALGTSPTMSYGGGGAGAGYNFFDPTAPSSPPGPPSPPPPPPIVLAGLILTAPNGTSAYSITVNDFGNLSAVTSATLSNSTYILMAPNGQCYTLGVSNVGVITLTPTSNAATFIPILFSVHNYAYKLCVNNSGIIYALPQFSSTMIIKSINNVSCWQVLIDVDGSLETDLVVNPGGTLPAYNLASANSSIFLFTASDFGELCTTQVSGAPYAGPLVLLDSSGTFWGISVGNDGAITTTVMA